RNPPPTIPGCSNGSTARSVLRSRFRTPTCEVEGAAYISMEYVDGEDLGGLLRRIGRLPGDKAVEIARKLCAGLGAAHAKGVLHRDLKPANIMINGRGQVLIMDFGLAAIA